MSTETKEDILNWAHRLSLVEAPPARFTVAKLIAQGWEVRVIHYRRWRIQARKYFGSRRQMREVNTEDTIRMDLSSCGGRTSVLAWAPGTRDHDPPTAVGFAICRRDEPYNKKVGVRVSLDRMEEQLVERGYVA